MARVKENVVISAGDCVLTLLPALGGKISSLRVRDHELLQAPLNPYATRTRTMSFDEGDASGWDECLPSVAACTIETNAGKVHVPDHGDLWRVAWRILEISDDSATLQVRCFSLPLEVTRTLLLSETETGWLLRAMYTIANRGNDFIPWSWAAHPLFVAEPGDRILLPESIRELRLEGSGGDRLGKNGDTIPWPTAISTAGAQVDLSVAQDFNSGIGEKLFAGPLDKASATENWCTLERQGPELRLTVRFDTSLTPYLGLWLCYGGWPERDGPRQMCVALEPTTAPVDSLAETGGWSKVLGPGQTFTWPMEVQIDRIAGQGTKSME